MNYIPIKQAAKVAHVAIKTLYRWVARGDLESGAGRLLVELYRRSEWRGD